MRSYDELINELCEICGIIPEYWDVFGVRHICSLETKRALLRAMGIKADSPEDALFELKRLQGKPWTDFIEPVMVVSEEQPLKIPVYVPLKEGEENRLTLSWALEDEKGQKYEFILSGDAVTVSDQQDIEGVRYIKTELSDAVKRTVGYYSVKVICEHPENVFPEEKNRIEKNAKVLITPDKCYIPLPLMEGKTWGITVNLYSVRSLRNWGIGDFTDLKKLIGFASELGAGFVGINPLHAIPNKKPYGISPYSPISRHYKNFIYLDIDVIPEVNESSEAKIILNSEIFKKLMNEVRKDELIDYHKIAFLKKSILRYAFEVFSKELCRVDSGRGREFNEYALEEGEALESFALYLTLWEHMKDTINAYIWQEWPVEYQNPKSAAVLKFRKENEKEVLFYKYIQWLIDMQHKDAAGHAISLGMPVGIYHDLAIGSIGGGSNSWSYQNLIAESIDVGAPPDDFNPNGQNWGFPPMSPVGLKESGYEFFIDIIRKNMKYNGALRIDHALGMFRLFWIPRGMSPDKGAYVKYPEEELLRIIALESVRNKTMVIAEDLGTVGENVRESLARFQMLSYKLLYFERDYPDPSFKAPEKYPEMALCAVTTHDLPTINGYWTGRDIEKREQLHMYNDENTVSRLIAERRRDISLLLEALKSQGILTGDFPLDSDALPAMADEICIAIYQYLALTPCKLIAVSLDDILGTLDQQNMPGTTDIYPNWMQKTPVGLDQIITNKLFPSLAGMFGRILF